DHHNDAENHDPQHWNRYSAIENGPEEPEAHEEQCHHCAEGSNTEHSTDVVQKWCADDVDVSSKTIREAFNPEGQHGDQAVADRYHRKGEVGTDEVDPSAIAQGDRKWERMRCRVRCHKCQVPDGRLRGADRAEWLFCGDPVGHL